VTTLLVANAPLLPDVAEVEIVWEERELTAAAEDEFSATDTDDDVADGVWLSVTDAETLSVADVEEL
jgi:hypothetical protein